MKRIVKRRKTSDHLALRIARAELRAVRRVVGGVAGQPKAGTHFIQCWAVSGRPVTQALDASGQVWERVWIKGTPTTPEQSWWEPLSMERRERKETT